MITNKVAPRTNIVMVRGKRMYLYGGKLFALGGDMGMENYQPMDEATARGQGIADSTTGGLVQGATSGMSAGPIGAVVGGLIGAVGGAVSGAKEQAQKIEEYNAGKLREQQRREEIAKTVNSAYPSKGVVGLHTMYSMGGKYAAGGMMQQPVQTMQQGVQPQQFQTAASNVQEVEGPSHEEGGVNAGNGNEVEGKEVIQAGKDGSSQVFSNRIPYEKGVSFADKASELAKQKGKYETLVNDKSLFARGTANRQIAKIDAEMQKLFEMQEQLKQQMQPPQPTPEQMQQGQQVQAAGENVMAQDAMQSAQPMQPQTQQQFALGGYMNGGDPKKPIKFNRNELLYDDQGNLTGLNTGETMDKLAGDGLTENETMTKMQLAFKGTESSTLGGGDMGADSMGGQASRKKGKLDLSKAGQYIDRAIPYADNLVNAILTANTPRVPKPLPDRTVPLKTDFNINPQLAAINETEANTAQALHNSTSDAATYRANIIAGKAGLVGQRNALYGQKENTETQLKNQNAMNVQGVVNTNIGKDNAYNMQNMQREGEIQTRISANVTNAVEDQRMQLMQDNLQKRDMLELEVLKQQYKDSGVYDRKLQGMLDAYQKGDITYEEFNKNVLQVYGLPKVKTKATTTGGME